MDFRRSSKSSNNTGGGGGNQVSSSVSAAQQRAEESRKIASARVKPGALTIKAKFLGLRQGKAGGGGQKATAIAGQGGGGGGGGGGPKKDPPMEFYAIPWGIGEVTNATKENPDYTVIDDDTIEMPVRDNGRMGRARKSVDEINKDNDALKKAGKPTLTEEDIKARVQELEDSHQILAHQRISSTDTLLVKCFDQNAVKALKPNDIVVLAGFYPDGNYWNGELRITYACTKPIQAQSTGNPLEDQYKIDDVNYVPVRIPNLNSYGSDSIIMAFNNFDANDEEYYKQQHAAWLALPEAERAKQEEEPVMFKRGPVISKLLVNPRDPNAWLIKSKDMPDRHKFEYTCEVLQDGSRAGFPGGRYMVMAVALDGDFSDEGQKRKAIRTAIGINDTAKYAAIMSTNSIPALITCSVNKKDMSGCNPGLDFGMEVPEDRIANIKCWANSITLMLNEYLCLFCPRVSEAWVKKRFRIDPKESGFRVEQYDAARPCFLNMESVTKANYKTVFKGPNVVLLDEWEGNVAHLLDDGGEFRVLHSARISDDQRDWMSQQPESVCEAIINRSDKAQNEWPDITAAFENVVTLVYCAKRLDLKEMDRKREETNEYWRKKALARHRREQARKKEEQEREKEEQEREEAAQIAAMEAMEQAAIKNSRKRPSNEEDAGDVPVEKIEPQNPLPTLMAESPDEPPIDAVVVNDVLPHVVTGSLYDENGESIQDENGEWTTSIIVNDDWKEIPAPVAAAATTEAKPKKRKVKRTTAKTTTTASPGRVSPARGGK